MLGEKWPSFVLNIIDLVRNNYQMESETGFVILSFSCQIQTGENQSLCGQLEEGKILEAFVAVADRGFEGVAAAVETVPHVASKIS
jgi:hypothetical protein